MASSSAPIKVRAGKYLTFQLGGEWYGLEILKVQEIIGLMRVTRIPGAPEFIRGIINLRGRVIPVMDLRLRFGIQAQEDTDRTCIVVVHLRAGDKNYIMGLLVDEVSEVLDVAEASIDDTPSFGTAVNTEYILGIGKVGQKVILLLETEKVLGIEEMSLIEKCETE